MHLRRRTSLPSRALRAFGVGSIVTALAVASLGSVAGAEPGDWNAAFGDCGLAGIDVQFATHAVTLLTPQNRQWLLQLGYGGTHDPIGVAIQLDPTTGGNATTGGTGSVQGFPGITYPSDMALAPPMVTKGDVVVGRSSLGPGLPVAKIGSSGGGAATLSFDSDPTTGDIADRVFDTPSVDASVPYAIVLGRIVNESGATLKTYLGADGYWSVSDAGFQALRDPAAAMQPDGKIIVAGHGAASSDTFSVYRINLDGTIDAGFPVTERLVPPASETGANSQPRAVVVQPDGKIVIGGDHTYAGATDLGFTRLNADGSLDTSFGTGGRTRLDALQSDTLQSMTLLDDGRIVGVGTAHEVGDSYSDLVVATLSPTGVKDPNLSILYDIGPGVVPKGVVTTSASTFAIGIDYEYAGDAAAGVISIRTDHTALGTGYVLDGWGGAHGFQPVGAPPASCVFDGPYWEGWDITRGIATARDQGGYILDGWGGLHPFGIDMLPAPAAANGGPYWTGWDIARGVALRSDGTGGYVVDGWGGIHGFGVGGGPLPPASQDGPYWRGWTIVRGIALLPDGTGGYVLDGWGGLHPFRVGSNPMPPAVTGGPYWTGWDIARGVSILPDGTGGYIGDAWGGLHPFAIGNHTAPAAGTGGPYWTGWDIARGVAFVDTTGMTAAATHAGGWRTVVLDASRLHRSAP